MAPLSQLSGHINSTCEAENSTSLSRTRPQAYYALSYCVLILAIVFGNGLVCVAVLRERALQTTTNYLVVSLAVADLLVATLVMPWVVYLEVTGGVWNFSRACCDVFVTMDVMMCTASILNLCAISIDRYMAVVMPVHYQHGTGQSSCRRVAFMITAVWVLAFAVSCPLLFGFNTTGDPHVCSISNPDFVIYSSVVSFYLPFGVTVLVYARIYVVLRQRRRKRFLTRQNSQCFSVRPGFPQQDPLLSHPRPLSPGRTHMELKRYYSICQDTALRRPGFQEGEGELKRAGRTRNSLMPLREKKATQMLAIVLGAFIVCWLPFFLTHVLNTHCQACHVSPELYSATTWLGYVNSALNPVIYTTFNIEFRKAFLKILSC
ncbi:PREDICTED: D(3) dopamine receptor isoform X2 [Condylura cristata]|uniref:D(3) dopamine receptor isoform X2 n=1 Tax=Condylura cristata TaxID=143302 RepID=UPI00064388C6|nr:PREDICTED: D(3) dopamine receptor isoform X2 [Condylura cristata]